MITGFNTDIEHNGVVYHVQTEDKGLESPIILSLVYSGGAILASKRSPYEDLIREGFSDAALAERLKRQHRLICAAIHTGRIDDLRRMNAREPEVTDQPIESVPQLELEVGEPSVPQFQPPPTTEEPPTVPEPEPEVPKAPQRPIVGSYRISKQQPVVTPEQTDAAATPPTAPATPAHAQEALPSLPEGLVVRLLDELEFYSGDSPTIRVLVTNREGSQETPIANATVSLKVLGTTFRPQIYSLKTERDGVVSVATQIPEFDSGRAAILIRASAKDQSAELRCIIHPKS